MFFTLASIDAGSILSAMAASLLAAALASRMKVFISSVLSARPAVKVRTFSTVSRIESGLMTSMRSCSDVDSPSSFSPSEFSRRATAAASSMNEPDAVGAVRQRLRKRLDVADRIVDAGLVARKDVVNAGDRAVQLGHQRLGAVDDALHGGGIGVDDGRILAAPGLGQRNRVRASADELDEGDPGEALALDLGARVNAHRRVRGNADARDDLGGVVRRKAHVLHRTHLDAVEQNRRADAKAGDLVGEDDTVGLFRAAFAEPGIPVGEGQRREQRPQREQANDERARSRFHQEETFGSWASWI